MAKTYAFRDFDGERILQRPYFKKFREEYHIGKETDEEILEMLKATEGNSLERLETKLKALRTANNLLVKFLALIHRHETRLNRYNKRAAENQQSAPIVEYFTAELDTMELTNKIADACFALGREIPKRYRQEFANRLRIARESAGLTQKQLGELVQVSPQGMSHYERAERDIPIHTIVRLAKVLKLNGDQILGLK